MKRLKKIISNDKGITLIELIASITILSIVILTFIAFFTNAFRFNSINDDSIQAMNIAREYQALIKEPDAEIYNLLNDNNLSDDAKEYLSLFKLEYPSENINNQFVLTINNPKYVVKVKINNTPEVSVDDTYNKLYLVHVEILEGDKTLSETYTYFELMKAGDPENES